MTLDIDEVREKIQSLRRGTLKTILYIVLLVVSLSMVNFIFGWEIEEIEEEKIPPYLQPYSSIILLINPYLQYIQGGLVFVLGYLTINAIAGLVYTYMRRISDHPTAATIRTITRISGIAVLLSLSASMFNVSMASALTVGSFGGLVVGFATQTILSHVVAGVFLLISRPFTYGDTVTVSTRPPQTGVVKEVKLMHIVLLSEDGTKEILIPSGTVVTQIIQKKRPPVAHKPAKTVLTLETPPSSVKVGSTIALTGKLAEATGKPITGTNVKIFDSNIGGDELLASGVTESDGGFSLKWTAKKTDRWDNTAEIYAKFEGNDKYRESKSEQYKIMLKT